MTEENKIKQDKEKQNSLAEAKKENKEDKNMEKDQEKKEEQAEKKKKQVVKIIPKNYAVANARNVRVSTKYSAAICKMIKGKKIDKALEMLEEVIAMKRPVKMENMEVGHKHGKGISGGRYPINACKEFIRLLKQLNANAIANGFDVEEGVITGKVNQASRRYRRMGERFKATHIDLRIESPKTKKKKKKTNKNIKMKKEGNK